MNTITLHNYESYVLDYLENNLSVHNCEQLTVFVALHPELDIDLNEALVSLTKDDNTIFNGKRN